VNSSESIGQLSRSNRLWGNLERYWADSDIREREPAHRKMQNEEMEKLVGLLRTGAPAQTLSGRRGG